ncbi:hypothetical protein UNSWDHB_2559 [Dehalobacter sp. UNSWDHB]|nr:hypothetical protein DHBDCA_p2396 [Dehalobacter sp. DCA]AFV06411.1 hypothetical protein DCF50_p2408 [Dehalobacter sp. CF]EQB20090.1 hypothetical protein UNSWDHB_2559 [Dehalobacter sp. UNSWDHB]
MYHEIKDHYQNGMCYGRDALQKMLNDNPGKKKMSAQRDQY